MKKGDENTFEERRIQLKTNDRRQREQRASHMTAMLVMEVRLE